MWSSGIEHFHFKKGISLAEFQNLQDGYAEITSESRYTQQTKALKIDDQRINEVAVKAAEVLLPWDEVSPLYFSEWLEKFSNAQGATKELMFLSILPTVSSLLGLCKLQMTTIYSENLALFTLDICPPTGGKNQCFSFGCKQPVSYVESKSAV